MQMLPLLPSELTLEKLNEHLAEWIDEYHNKVHSSTGKSPLQRYLDHLEVFRKAPKDLWDYFRIPAERKVDKDRTVSLNGTLYEAPAGLIGKNVTLLYHKKDPNRVEVFIGESSYGFLTPLNVTINSRVRRTAHQRPELIADPPATQPQNQARYRGGSLFEKEEK
jgi:hypothetical protein